MKTTTNKHHSRLSTLNFLYLSFFLHHVTLPIAGDSLATYSITDLIVLDCGSTGNSTALDQRVWMGDDGSKFAPSDQQKSTSSRAEQSPSFPSVPYLTARISRSKFTYTFPVTAGPKFIRLYFYPASYPDFDSSKSFFSVKAGTYTLLHNFSASLTAASLKKEYVVKEYCVNVEDKSPTILNITFSPEASYHPDMDAYAFINGIEIVSMPAHLYYPRDEQTDLPLIGFPHSPFHFGNNIALEMAHRLNVGGRSLSPVQDSGLFRSWFDDDSYYCWLLRSAVPTNSSIHIKYTLIPSYTAPEEVYQTARTMGYHKEDNKRYNLTWKLPVDPGFTYLVRLHFCEFQPGVWEQGDRRFQIFINNQTAAVRADVIYWSGGPGIPVYKDYVVRMEKLGDLFIELHPADETWTRYSDAILNGLEVFKLSNTADGNLAAPNPEPILLSPVKSPAPTTADHKSKIKRLTVLITVGGSAVVGGLAILSLLGCIVFRRRRDPYQAVSSRTKASSLPTELCRHFSLAEIRAATDNFNDDFVIGLGGFGNVYKGYIDGDQNTVVAIKRLNPESRQGVHEFWTEIELLSQLRHPHLVSLLGFCNDKPEMILVYDYMTNGTLREHLYGTHNDPLHWKKRLQICIGAARGLDYLHTGAKRTIIHRDVKTTNILLDDKMVAKVSDFGLSKMGPTTVPNAEVATMVKGTWGYLDPEYTRRGLLTEKSDVYSFGVVLLEVLCGRKAVDHKLEVDQVSLAHWAQKCIREETFDQIIDPYLMGRIEPACVREFMEIAERCILEEGIERPTMRDVVGSLDFALKMQVDTGAAKEDIMLGGGAPGENIIYEESAFRAAIISAHNNVVSRDRGHVLDSSNSGISMMGTSTSGLSYSSVDAGSIMTSGDEFSDTTNSKGQLKSGKI